MRGERWGLTDVVEAEEMWGRFDSPHCVTAANMFRLSGPNNGLILSRKHHILELGWVDSRQQTD